MRIKNRLYYHLVEKNEIVNQKYNEYVERHIIQQKKARFVHWIYLLGLNIRYFGKSKDFSEKDNSIKESSKKTAPKTAPNVTPKTITPYIGGTESSRIFISKSIHFAKKLLKYGSKLTREVNI